MGHLHNGILLSHKHNIFDFLRFSLFIFRERGREGEKEGEKYQCVVASHMASTGDLAHNPGMCPDWESNQRPYGSHTDAQPTEPHLQKEPLAHKYFSS